eukprot:Pgem_evm1s11794
MKILCVKHKLAGGDETLEELLDPTVNIIETDDRITYEEVVYKVRDYLERIASENNTAEKGTHGKAM